jgi:AcrR family transcriptional regulator
MPEGLRERKKARTRTEIQRHAVRLFRDQGYAQTSMEQVAAAAEVSPSTVFRYFATKEELVVFGDFSPIVDVLLAQPPELAPIPAFRAAMRAAWSAVESPELVENQLSLIFEVPQLWAASLANITDRMELVADAIGTRTGRPAESAEIRNITGALLGVFLAVAFAPRDPEVDLPTAVDRALVHLESGLPV